MDVLAAHAARHPDQPALVEGERVWSWAEFIGRRNRLAHGLLTLGLPAGGQVIVYSENSLEHHLAGGAARSAGLIPAPMNRRLVAEEVAYTLDHSDAVAVLVSDRSPRCGASSSWARSAVRGPSISKTCGRAVGPSMGPIPVT